jgi:hypothetical protein
MKYYADEVINLIEKEISKINGEKILIKVENFQEISLYFEICKNLEEICFSKGIELIVKLSNGKYKEVMNKKEIKFFKDKNWIDLQNHMTNYRNMPVNKKTLILLLATEMVEDRGGLEDFFLISPEIIDQNIGSKFHGFFIKKYDGTIEGYEEIIDKVFKSIFNYYPKNLFKLSCLLDELPQKIKDIDELLELIFSRLHTDWNIPRILTIPQRSQLKKGTKISILEKAIRFAQRKDFIDLTKSKFDKLEKQLDKFEREELNNSGISGDEFIRLKGKLLEYALGKNLLENRNVLFNVDFYLLDKILQLKIIGKPPKKSEKKIVLRGEPFEVISRALLTSISSYFSDEDEKNLNVSSVEILFHEVGIAEVSEETEEELFNVWRNICNYTGGILEFINKEGFLLNDSKEEIELNYEIGQEFFKLSNAKILLEAGILKKLPVTKKLSSIKFSINLNNREKTIYSKEIEWKFKNNDDWLMSFSFLNSEFEDEILKSEYTPFIPSGTVKNIKNFLYLNDEEEFFDLLEKNELDLNENICNQSIISESEFYETFQLLGLGFNKMLKEISKEGLFNAINKGYITTFLGRYKGSIDRFKNVEINQSNKEIIEIFIKLFSVVDINEKIENSLDIDIAIIPAYHPATLEKIQEKYIFLRSGLVNLFKVLMTTSEDSEKIIREKLQTFNDLSSIESSIDILIGSGKKYLDTRGVYGLFTVLSSKQLETENKKRLDYNTILKKENALTDEEIRYKECPTSLLITGIIEDYMEVYPSAIDGLKLSFITPSELQPIISSLNSLIENYSDSILKDEVLKIKLNIFLDEENIGGKSYLVYWIENIFEEDSKIDIEIFYNTHSNKDELSKNIEKYLDYDTDLSFFTDILEEKTVEFRKLKNLKIGAIENKFPMVFKPLPVRKESLVRSIEISQPQFEISTIHSQLVCKYQEGEDSFEEKSVIKEYSFPEKTKILLEELKNKSNWTICLDKGIDQHIISHLEESNIIGFFPGQGAFGEYNLTVSGKNESLKILEKRLQTRLKKTFNDFDKDDLEIISKNCLKNISELNGIRILKALNVNDYRINDFLAYFMSHKLIKENEKCWGMIPLDFHQRWFSGFSKRPDFLKFEVNSDAQDNVKIKATLIECKLANENIFYKEEALHQIEEGYRALKEKFSNESTLIERRYWFAQLYKNMIYSEVLESECNHKYQKLSEILFKILDGDFEIEWEGKIFTYWINSQFQEISHEIVTSSEDIKVECFEIPKIKIKKLLKEDSFIDLYCFNGGNKEEIGEKETKEGKYISPNKSAIPTDISRDLGNDPEIPIEIKKNEVNNDNTLEKSKSVFIKKMVGEVIDNNFISVLDTQEENNDIEFEKNYAKTKIKTLCSALRKNKVDVDPYLENNDTGIIVGPNFIKLKLKLDIGTSITKIEKLNKDIKMWLSLDEIPIIYADKGYVAVEISRQKNLTIKLGCVLSKLDLNELRSGLKFVLGIDEEYNPYILDLADSNNPHLLIAGATGSGKSVLINSIIVNLMSIHSPEELEFIFIDPKVVELSIFQNSPYLKGRKISTEAEIAVKNLKYIVEEMERRYKLLALKRVRNIEGYNGKVEKSEKLPRVVIVFDEFADFMEDKDFKEEIESSIKRISAKARAAGIHMIICTQSPRGDVITTTIRNNLGARVGLRVPDHHASNLILNDSGAENLKGKGDMLFKSPNTPESIRLKSPYLSDKEIEDFLNEVSKVFKGVE